MLTGKPTGKRPLGTPRLTWEDNIRMDLKEIGINTRTWVESAEDRDNRRALENAALNLWVPDGMELVLSPFLFLLFVHVVSIDMVITQS